MAKLLTFDVETTAFAQVRHSNSPDPYSKNNWPVWLGWKLQGQRPNIVGPWDTIESVPEYNIQVPGGTDIILNGHNIKFDLAYANRFNWTINNVPILKYVRKHGHIWDTMVAEYMLSAFQDKMPGLDFVAEKYNLPLKHDIVKQAIKSGGSVLDIPCSDMEIYLEGDITVPEKIAAKQIKRMHEIGMLPFAKSYMRFLLLTFEMENNGNLIDVEIVQEVQSDLENQREKLHTELLNTLCGKFPKVPKEVWNLKSPVQLASVFFGGEIKWQEQLPVLSVTGDPITYKTGKRAGEIKTKNTGVTAHIEGFKVKPLVKWQTKTGYSTGDVVLTALEDREPFFKKLKEFRDLSKQIDTYCVGILDFVSDDGFVHQQLLNTSTYTMRLSCMQPNMQNIPRKGDVKRFFKSRFGDDGVIVQADYSQLEVVVMGWFSEDTNFKQDILDGIDFHCLRLAWASEAMLGKKYSYQEIMKGKEDIFKDARTKAKTVSFQRAYGSGAQNISEGTGIPVDVVKLMFKEEDERYPGIKLKEQEVLKQVRENFTPNTHLVTLKNNTSQDGTALKAGTGVYKVPVGTILGFKQFQKFDLNELSFSPTQIKNYPIQHFAFVCVVLGCVKLYKELINNNFFDGRCLPINTVHDSVVFDVHKNCVEDAVKIIKKSLESVPDILYDEFGIDFDLPLKVDLEQGPNWKDLNKVA